MHIKPLIVRSLIGGVTLVFLWTGLPSAAFAGKHLDIEKLADGVYAAFATEEGEATSNSGFIINKEDVLVIDSHLTVEAARELVEAIKKRTHNPVKYVVLTHHHPDHSMGAQIFPEATEIVAHENTRRRLLDKAIATRLPALTFRNRLVLHRGERIIEIFFPGRAHTDGDAIVYLPQESIVFAGDLVMNGWAGYLHDAYLKEWLVALELIRSLPAHTIVPGHGRAATQADVATFRDYLHTFIQEVSHFVDAGKTVEEAVRHISLPAYAHLKGHDRFWEQNVRRAYQELKK